jgi:hypothetical protein
MGVPAAPDVISDIGTAPAGAARPLIAGLGSDGVGAAATEADGGACMPPCPGAAASPHAALESSAAPMITTLDRRRAPPDERSHSAVLRERDWSLVMENP